MPKRRLKPESTGPGEPARRLPLDQDREARFTVIDEMREACADVSTDEIKREVAKALAEVRAEMEAERMRSDQAK